MSRTIRLRNVAVVAGLVFAVAAAACTNGSPSTAGEDRAVEVTLKEFSITPAMIPAPSGSAFILRVANQGSVPHALALDASGQTLETPLLNAGQAFDLAVPALDAGHYDVWCTVAGHKQAGMTAKLMADPKIA
ncbi:MAG TPA: cupredoxin domain-containing protein, partial [Actinomycetota bacterium]|nr:cupredoxin domain-containing protein [Actinomycetota bacterium]